MRYVWTVCRFLPGIEARVIKSLLKMIRCKYVYPNMKGRGLEIFGSTVSHSAFRKSSKRDKVVVS